MLKDYQVYGMRKEKSIKEVRAKDLYRLEVESLVAELTDIEELEEAENKMRRLKKRHKNLISFDKDYFMGLNGEDLALLS